MSNSKKILIGISTLIIFGLISVIWKFYFNIPIEGRIYVTLNNGETKRLSVVRVRIMDEKTAMRWKAEVIEQYDTLLGDLTNLKKNYSSEVRKIQSSAAARLKLLNDQLSFARKAQEMVKLIWLNQPSDQSARNELLNILVKAEGLDASFTEMKRLASNLKWQELYVRLQKTSDKLKSDIDMEKSLSKERLAELKQQNQEKLSGVGLKVMKLLSSNSLASAPPKFNAFAQDISDDNGDFRFSVTNGTYYIIASSERAVPFGQEIYNWAVKVHAPSALAEKCHLTSRNLIGQNKDDLWADLPNLFSEMNDKHELELGDSSLDFSN